MLDIVKKRLETVHFSPGMEKYFESKGVSRGKINQMKKKKMKLDKFLERKRILDEGGDIENDDIEE